MKNEKDSIEFWRIITYSKKIFAMSMGFYEQVSFD